MTEEASAEEQIKIPTDLTGILKQYTKAAIRSQPKDLLKWSARYFRALANGEIPDIKERLEFFGPGGGGLSQTVVKILHIKLKAKDNVLVGDLKKEWNELSLDNSLLLHFMEKVGVEDDAEHEVDWIKILALATAATSKNLKDTMENLCEILTDNPNEPRMSFAIFQELYPFLAKLNDVPLSHIENVLAYLASAEDRQDNMVYPSNFDTPHCPPL